MIKITSRYGDILFISIYKDNVPGINAWTIWRCSQLEKICSKLIIFMQLNITKNMCLERDNTLISFLDAPKHPIQTDVLIWDTVWDVIVRLGQITVGIMVTVDMYR